MERLVMSSSSMKDHSNLDGRSNARSPAAPPPPSWSCTTNSTITTTSHHHQHQHPDYLSGFTWPPRSYTCTFCKREFRSAQALGGHMNVHRRDRARLRQYSPPPLPPRECPILNLNANPNPNPSFSSAAAASSPPSPSPAGRRSWAEGSVDHLTKVGTRKSLFGAEFDGSNKLRKRGGEINVSLELEIGSVVNGGGGGSSKKEQLDLELRLGI